MNFLAKCFRCALTLISPKLNTYVCFFVKFKRFLDLKNPKTLDEKISKLKLEEYGKNELVRECADKYRVRDYLTRLGYKDLLIPLITDYEKPDQIDWEALPDKFVIKWNFGCGFNIICDNVKTFDKKDAIRKMKKWEKNNYYLEYSEMQYKNVPKRIIIEKYISENDGTLPSDYKFYCFNGKAYCVMVCVQRETGNPKFYFFDEQWNLLRINRNGKEAPVGFSLQKPDGIDIAFRYADKLSKPFKFVRVDLYIVNGKVYFGEFTFTPSGGMDTSRLPETDVLFGKLLQL